MSFTIITPTSTPTPIDPKNTYEIKNPKLVSSIMLFVFLIIIITQYNSFVGAYKYDSTWCQLDDSNKPIMVQKVVRDQFRRDIYNYAECRKWTDNFGLLFILALFSSMISGAAIEIIAVNVFNMK